MTEQRNSKPPVNVHPAVQIIAALTELATVIGVFVLIGIGVLSPDNPFAWAVAAPGAVSLAARARGKAPTTPAVAILAAVAGSSAASILQRIAAVSAFVILSGCASVLGNARTAANSIADQVAPYAAQVRALCDTVDVDTCTDARAVYAAARDSVTAAQTAIDVAAATDDPADIAAALAAVRKAGATSRNLVNLIRGLDN